MADEKTPAPAAPVQVAVVDPAAQRAAEVAAKAAADAEAQKKSRQKPLYAINRINGTIEPGSIFKPLDADQRKELLDVGAARELTEDETTLFGAKADPLG